MVYIVSDTRCHIGIRHQYLTADIAGIATRGMQVQRQVFPHGLQPLNGQLSVKSCVFHLTLLVGVRLTIAQPSGTSQEVPAVTSIEGCGIDIPTVLLIHGQVGQYRIVLSRGRTHHMFVVGTLVVGGM